MSEEDHSGEKTEEPTQKKLQDARAKGDVPKSSDLTYSAALLGFLASLLYVSNGVASDVVQILAIAIYDPEKLAGQAPWSIDGMTYAILSGIVILFAAPAFASLLALVSQRSITFSPKKISPKLSRISLGSGLKNKFGKAGLFEFAKSSTKMIVFSVLIFSFLYFHASALSIAGRLSPITAISFTSGVVFDLAMSAFGLLVVIGAIDFLWQIYNHKMKNMMSKKDIQDEHKASEGDPNLKGQRRQRGYEIAMNQMLAAVPDADVVIVNPTHYAVALQWSPSSGRPPVCVAKGVDDVAARIRVKARAANVPIFRSPAVARSIFALVQIGDVIEPNMYKAVAAAIRFAQQMRKNR